MAGLHNVCGRCKVCTLFAKEASTGKGNNRKLGSLITCPYVKYKHALEMFDAHQKTESHGHATEMADNFLATYTGKKEDICSQIDSSRKTQVIENRQKLVPII
jgi:hypothetical protein